MGGLGKCVPLGRRQHMELNGTHVRDLGVYLPIEHQQLGKPRTQHVHLDPTHFHYSKHLPNVHLAENSGLPLPIPIEKSDSWLEKQYR